VTQSLLPSQVHFSELGGLSYWLALLFRSFVAVGNHQGLTRCSTLTRGKKRRALVSATLGALMARIFRSLVIAASALIYGHASATDCLNSWLRPALQSMSMDSGIAFTLSEYRSGERHFSIAQGQDKADIYYLKGFLLVKGYSETQIANLGPNVIFTMPMAFAVPISVLAEAAPKGPCNIAPKTPVALQLSGTMRLQDRKLTRADGEVLSSALGKVAYEMDIAVDPPIPDKATIRYSGEMSFDTLPEQLEDDIDVSGYLIVTRSRPYPAVGSATVPVSKLGDLRRFLATRQRAPNPAPQKDAPPAARP
jgi:hypothetical protein